MRRFSVVLAGWMALAVPAMGASPDGVWVGSYTCLQGRTPLSLFVSTDTDGVPAAYFHFGKAGTDRPEGCFTMQGTALNGRMSLTAAEWRRRPVGYVTVDLNGMLSADSFAGTVVGPGCTSFSLTRGTVVPLPQACRKHMPTA